MPGHRKTRRTARDTYNYDLNFMGFTVYKGISKNPEERAKQHEREGKVFDEVKITSRKRSRKRAEKEETEAIQNNFLGPPPLNIQKTGRKRNPFGGW